MQVKLMLIVCLHFCCNSALICTLILNILVLLDFSAVSASQPDDLLDANNSASLWRLEEALSETGDGSDLNLEPSFPAVAPDGDAEFNRTERMEFYMEQVYESKPKSRCFMRGRLTCNGTGLVPLSAEVRQASFWRQFPDLTNKP